MFELTCAGLKVPEVGRIFWTGDCGRDCGVRIGGHTLVGALPLLSFPVFAEMSIPAAAVSDERVGSLGFGEIPWMFGVCADIAGVLRPPTPDCFSAPELELELRPPPPELIIFWWAFITGDPLGLDFVLFCV